MWEFFLIVCFFFFFFQAEDGIRDYKVTGVQTCALPILYMAIQNSIISVQIQNRFIPRTDQRPYLIKCQNQVLAESLPLTYPQLCEQDRLKEQLIDK